MTKRRYYTISQVANILEVSVQTVRRKTESGDIPGAYKRLGRMRWDADKIDAYAKTLEHPNAK